MVYSYQINGLIVQTGDLICTIDGGDIDIKGQFWRLIGKLIPGEVEHIVIFVGPGGRCVEAGARGKVITFDIIKGQWNAEKMILQRGLFNDVFYGVAHPLKGRNIDSDKSMAIRESVASYCLEQARLEKSYNINFLNSDTEDAFYCSQLAYKAYLKNGIDLNTGQGIPKIPGTGSIIFPQEIWAGCTHVCVGK
jgi:hypothetical protein